MTRQEAEELLPWFVNGTLSSEEASAVQAFIDSGEISQTEIEEVRLFAETIQEQSADEPAFNATMIEDVMAKLDTVEQEAAEPAVIVAEPQKESLWHRLTNGFGWSLMPPLAKVAVAGQFALVVALGAALLNTDTVEENSFDVVSGAAPERERDIQVIFAPTATEEEIRNLLASFDGVIVDGPSAQGIYAIDVADEFDHPETVQKLADSNITLIVQPTD